MENKNKELISNKIDELIVLIKNTEDYKRYSYLKEEMKKNNSIMDLIKEIKKEEQKRVKKEYNHEDISNEDKIIEQYRNELLTYPSYQEYLYLQEDINYQLQSIRQIIENSFNKE